MTAPLREIRAVTYVPHERRQGLQRGIIIEMVCGHQKFMGGTFPHLSKLLGTQTRCISGCYTPDQYFGRY